jgi:hypothetical protein
MPKISGVRFVRIRGGQMLVLALALLSAQQLLQPLTGVESRLQWAPTGSSSGQAKSLLLP